MLLLYMLLLLCLSKDDTINIMNCSNLVDKRAKNYYENDKDRLREQARDKYRNISEEEKNKKGEYGKNRYCNMSEEKKQRLKEHQKNYRAAKKSQYNE